MRPLLASVLLLAACQNGGVSQVAAPGPAPSPSAAPSYGPGAESVVAYWKGGKMTFGELSGATEKQANKMVADYLTQRYEMELQAIDDQVNEQILGAEAKAQGAVDVNALLKTEVEQKAPAPTEGEIAEAYNSLKRKLGNKTLEEARDDVTKAVLRQKQSERFQAYVAELRTKHGVVVQLPYPDVPRIQVSVDDDPSMGPADAPITIVQFADYQCPYCGRAQEAVDQVLKDYDGKVRFVFRDFPLSFHQQATPAAVAANCAGKQEKFWPVHHAIMKDQRALSEADLERLAVNAGVDLGKWNECRQDSSMTDEISKDERDGAEAGVSGTPAFFINGIFLNGAQPYEKFKAIIDRELAVKKG